MKTKYPYNRFSLYRKSYIMFSNTSLPTVEEVILVNENDEEVGLMEKMEAHRKGVLHRAFSFFIFNKKGEMMLQQRALSKYHSGGLWTNACCSHPRANESTLDAAKRRVREEMGFDCIPQFAFSFIYKAALDQDLIEHELDHVFTGIYEGEVHLNPEEVADYQYLSIAEIRNKMASKPEIFTEWFKIVFERVVKGLSDLQ